MSGVDPGPDAEISLSDGSAQSVNGFNLSYHNKETILITIDPYYGNLNYVP